MKCHYESDTQSLDYEIWGFHDLYFVKDPLLWLLIPCNLVEMYQHMPPPSGYNIPYIALLLDYKLSHFRGQYASETGVFAYIVKMLL